MLEVIAQLPCMVSDEQTLSLKEPISRDELIMAVNDMHSDKSLRPNGWRVEFYSGMFEVNGEDLLFVVEESRVKGRVLEAFNSTFLMLILKFNHVTMMKKLHPISL